MALSSISTFALLTCKYDHRYVPFVIVISPEPSGKMKVYIRHILDPSLQNALTYSKRMAELAEQAQAAAPTAAAADLDTPRLSRIASDSISVASSATTKTAAEENLPYAELVTATVDDVDVAFVLKSGRSLQREHLADADEITLLSVQVGAIAAADPTAQPAGVPVRVKTLAIKSRIDMSHVEAELGVGNLWRFFYALLDDIPQLQAYLPAGLVTAPQLELAATVLRCLEKHITNEDLRFQCNISASLHNVNNDLILGVSAPYTAVSAEERLHSLHTKPLHLMTTVDVQDLLQDFRTIMSQAAL